LAKILLLAAILVPLASSFIVFAQGRVSKRGASILSAVLCGVDLSLVLGLYALFNKGYEVAVEYNVGLPFKLALKADALGLILALIGTTLALFVSFYCIEYIDKNKGLFGTFLHLSMYGMIGIVFSKNLFTLLIFFELFSIASAFLVIHKQTPEAIRAGFQYLFISVVGTACLIGATAILYSTTGSLDLMGQGIVNISKGPWILVFWLLVAGFGVKAGMFPAHIWLPESYPAAPSAAAAILSGAMAKVGAYGIIRVVYGVYGKSLAGPSTTNVLLTLAVITMIGGSLAAITQSELKKMLAYSSVAQIGYVILGAALMSPLALAGGVLHIINHALMKSSLFLACGSIIKKTGKSDLASMKGIGKKMPMTMTTFTLAALSMIGIPPFVGFFSKWLLATGTMQSMSGGNIAPWAAYVTIGMIVLSGLLNALYFGPIIINGWFGEKKKASAHHGHEDKVEKIAFNEPSWVMLTPMFLLGISTFLFGIYIKIPLRLVEKVVSYYF